MGNAYIFTLQPTFTQGLILGQLSILFLLVVILKYLFLDSVTGNSHKALSYQPRIVINESDEESSEAGEIKVQVDGLANSTSGTESTDWLNLVLQQVLDAYRLKLRNNLPGLDGEEVARLRIEEFANKIRPPSFVDPIKVHSVDLGVSAPRLSGARHKPSEDHIELDVNYTDTISISFSTSVLFNYPFPSFARLPVSLTISLSLFSSSVLLTPPQPQSEHPTLTITLPTPQTEFVLDLRTTSLLGSRAKLADVPKLHELINHQIRKVIQDKGTWKIVLPGLASVKEVKDDVEEEQRKMGHPF
ncbi:maintenance of mitochondrial morphology protein 1 [Abortiporus biennis]|nr:maintenance of mitochondrial morphology protein 1 [Abortiporus biennis]